MMGRTVGVAMLALVLAAPVATDGQSTDDIEAVRQAATDYLEGFYEGDEERLRRGVHPDVTKYGFFLSPGSDEYTGAAMSFEQMLDFARSVRESGTHPPPSAPREVSVGEVLDQTATAKVIAWWGSDYLHLAKYEGRWQIIHVLWQSPPR
ncbi:MAG: nuclear transport factor 2 family protein [Gemmatimonadota bacterium]|nr:nuclear transport factor 2 family protein [Gemmatimonadota bacterium]MDH5759881.1 nuclear transport factor 2 family protein [Gemmatimonadota bacterium]